MFTIQINISIFHITLLLPPPGLSTWAIVTISLGCVLAAILVTAVGVRCYRKRTAVMQEDQAPVIPTKDQQPAAVVVITEKPGVENEAYVVSDEKVKM